MRFAKSNNLSRCVAENSRFFAKHGHDTWSFVHEDILYQNIKAIVMPTTWNGLVARLHNLFVAHGAKWVNANMGAFINDAMETYIDAYLAVEICTDPSMVPRRHQLRPVVRCVGGSLILEPVV